MTRRIFGAIADLNAFIVFIIIFFYDAMITLRQFGEVRMDATELLCGQLAAEFALMYSLGVRLVAFLKVV